MNNIKTILRRGFCVAAFLLFSAQASAIGMASHLGYNIGNDQLSGYSETYSTYEDEGAICLYLIYNWGDWYLDPPVCGLYEYAWYTYSVEGWLDGPFGPISSDAAGDYEYGAGVGYHLNRPSAGFYAASANHYVKEHTWWCEMQMTYFPPEYFCYPAYTFDHYIGSTSAGAQVGCVHRGTPNNGSMTGDELLPSEAWGYKTHSANRWGCNYWLLTKIPAITASWSYNHSFIQAGVGRISVQHGGSGDGVSHRNGLDVDLRYVRSDYAEAAEPGYDPRFSFDEDSLSEYHQQYTNDLVQAFCDAGAVLVGVDSRAGITASCAQVWSGHYNHFHVRFPDPDGTNN